jgi:hypothetical protein
METRSGVPGPRVVFVGIFIVLAIVGFVVLRVVQTSGPGPDPSTIPARPGARADSTR